MSWPIVSYGTHHVERKGEDFHSFHDLVWRHKNASKSDPGVSFLAFGIYDGHGGVQSADYVRSNLIEEFTKRLTNMAEQQSSSAESSSRHYWDSLHVKAIKEAFIYVDEQCRKAFERSGTTATVVLVVREHPNEAVPWISRFPGDARRVFITVANVGDSSVYLDTGGSVQRLNEEHRAGTNKSETKRVEESGGSITRDDTKSPYRLYPGGLMMTRTIGDRDAHQAIAEPALAQLALRVQLGSGGGRIIIASDGLWDAVTPKESVNLVRKTKSAAQAARALVREASKREGRHGDDVTVTVLDLSAVPEVPFADILPAENVPNKHVIMWKPLQGENLPEYVRQIQALKRDEDNGVFFREGEIVIFEADANKKEYKVVACEGTFSFLQNRGWVLSSKLKSAMPAPVAPVYTAEELREFAIQDEEAYNEQPPTSESPAWEESLATRKKKLAASKKGSKKEREEEKNDREEKDDQGKMAKKKRSRSRRDRKSKADSPTVDSTASEQPETVPLDNDNTRGESGRNDNVEGKEMPELEHQLFIVGFPDDWSAADARQYFTRFGMINSMLLKDNPETKERAIFLSFTDTSSNDLDSICGKYIINTCHMFVVRTEDAFGDMLTS